jgi:hypothetical protein
VRAVVLDAAYAVDGFDPWVREESVAIRLAWDEVCRRSASCASGAPLDELRQMALRLEAKPLTGIAQDADGVPHRVRVDGAALGQIAGDASYYYTIYRDLLAAQQAYLRGDPAPLMRIGAEDLPFTGGGPVRSYSEGAYAAVACHDYPTIWDRTAPLAERREQLRAARATLAPDAYAPIPNDIWLRSLYIDQVVSGCIRWPEPARPPPAGAARHRLPERARAGTRRRSRRDHPDGRLGPRGLAVPRSHARARRELRPRDSARGLRRLHLGDRPPLPAHALTRGHELREPHTGDPRRARVPAPGGGGARRRAGW